MKLIGFVEEDDKVWVELGPRPPVFIKEVGPCSHVNFNEDRLDEVTYKQVISKIDNNFLQQKVRAQALEGVTLTSIQGFQRQFVFWVKSAEHAKNKLTYSNYIRFHKKDWNEAIDDETLNPIKRARKIMFEGNVLLHCTCPSWLYWGYKYIAHQHDASIDPETRAPVVRNPQQRGIVCKHMHRVIKAFPFYSGNFASYIKTNYPVAKGRARDWDLGSKVSDIMKALRPSIEVDYKDIIGSGTDQGEDE